MEKDDRFNVVGRAVVTLHGLVLVVRDESRHWRFPGIQVSPENEVDYRVKKGLKDMLDIDMEPHQFIDAVNVTENAEENILELFLHLEASSKDTEPSEEEMETKWVDPSKLDEYLEEETGSKMKRRELSNFIEKLESMPSGELG